MFDSANNLISAVLAVVVVLSSISAYRHRRGNPHALPYPPGPSPRSLVGNFFDIPKKRPYIEYAHWSKRYNSDIVSFHVPGFHTVIVNSAKVAKDLFEKRSAIYSDRPSMEMTNLMGFEFSTGLMPYSDSWRTHRRMIHQMFRPDALPAYEPLQRDTVKSMLQRVLQNPSDVVNEVKHYAGYFPIKLAYGRDDVDPMGDRYIRVAEEAMEMVGDMLFPGAILLNAFPTLKHLPKWLPGIYGFKTFAEKCHLLTDEIKNSLFDAVKLDIANGQAPSSLTTDYLHKLDIEEQRAQWDEKTVREVMANIHLGAADTSMAAMQGAILALVLNPQAQTRAQAELDERIGRDRLPDFSDRQHLPFVNAICREVLRLNPVLPLALAHAALRDDIYEGWFIPKGSLVMGNSWAILHDPEVYPEPEKFRPERFITPEGDLSDDDIISVFGFGRRICPGRHFAANALFLVVASVLSQFDLVRAKDEAGKEIEVGGEYVDAGICHPVQFVCVARARDERAEALLRATG